MCPVRDPTRSTEDLCGGITDELLGVFRRELQVVREAALLLDAGSQEYRMHLGFRITSLVDVLTSLVERAVSGPDARAKSRTDLAEMVSTSCLLTSGEARVLERWLFRHHAVSVFLLQATCIRWSHEIQHDAPTLEDIAGRLSASGQPGGAVAR